MKISISNQGVLLAMLVPALNFLVGINIDLYSPALLAVAHYYQVTAVSAKSSIVIGIVGWGVGCVIFGVLLDLFSRKNLILFALFFYSIFSFVIIFTKIFFLFLVLRFLQSFMIAALTVCCRALIINYMSGTAFLKSMLSASLAYSAGPVLAPPLGAILLNYFNWHGIFITLGLVGLIFYFLVNFIEDKKFIKLTINFSKIFQDYKSVAMHNKFLLGLGALSIGQTEILFYPTVGPFLINNIMHGNTNDYAKTALFIASGYMLGAILSRWLMKRLKRISIYKLGFYLQASATFFAFLFAIYKLTFVTLTLPVFLLTISVGLISPNLYSEVLQQHKNKIGAVIALLVAGLSFVSGSILYFIGHLTFEKSIHLAYIYLLFALIQPCLFFYFSKNKYDDPLSFDNLSSLP